MIQCYEILMVLSSSRLSSVFPSQGVLPVLLDAPEFQFLTWSAAYLNSTTLSEIQK